MTELGVLARKSVGVSEEDGDEADPADEDDVALEPREQLRRDGSTDRAGRQDRPERRTDGEADPADDGQTHEHDRVDAEAPGGEVDRSAAERVEDAPERGDPRCEPERVEL